jgi:xylulokinase
VGQACAATVRVAETIGPRDAVAMEEAYARFRRMYPALRSLRA